MSPTTDDDEEGFSYSGQLLFNGLYTTTLKEGKHDDFTPTQAEAQITNQLPDLSASTDGGVRSGFRSIGLQQYLSEYNFGSEEAILSESVHPGIAADVLDEEYVQEEFLGETRIVTEDAQRVTGQEVEEHSAYLYWNIPSLLIVHGAKPDRKRAMRAVYEALGIANDETESFITIDPVEFNPWFLLWLVYQDSQSRTIGRGMDILRIQDIRLQSRAETRDEFGNKTQVSGSTDVLRSVPVIAGLLRGMLPVGLEAKFDLGGAYIDADISDSGRTHIRAEEDIRAATKLERVLIGIQFVQNLVGTQQEWAYMDPANKYVTPEFAKTLYDNAKNQDVSIDFDKELVHRQVDNRNESLDDWNHLDFS